jgi:hypothetical protein
MGNEDRKKFRQTLAVLLIVAILGFISPPPKKAQAISIFTPFGGKVEEYDPAPSMCLTEITTPVAVATAFTTWITIEKVKVGKPKEATLGFLRVNLVPVMPPPTNIKRNYAYFVPGTWVLGNSIDLCGICRRVEQAGEQAEKLGLGFAKNLCKSIPGIGEILDAICGIAGDCPITNLIYQIGTGSPIAGVIENAKKTACKTILEKVPLIGSFLSKACDNL